MKKKEKFFFVLFSNLFEKRTVRIKFVECG